MIQKYSRIALPLKISFLIFSMVLNCMGIIILQLSANNISYTNLGFLEAFKDLPIAIFSLFAATFINRFGSKPSLIFSLLTVAVCSLLLPFVGGFWFFKLWFAIIGISFSVAKISVYGILRNNILQETPLAKVMSSVEASFMIGIFVVNIGFGWLISSQYSDYWKFGFWIISLLAFGNVFLLMNTKMAGDAGSSQIFSLREVTEFFSRKYFIFFLIIFSIVFIEQNFNSWLPSFYKKHLNVNSFFALQASAFLALFSYIGRIVTARIIQHFSLARYFIGCTSAILMMLFLFQTLVTNGYLQITLFIFPLIGLFLSPLYPVISSQMITNITKTEIHLFTSLIVIFSSLGSSVGSVVMSYVFELEYGSYFALFISGAVIVLLLLSFIYFRSYVSKKENNC